MTAKKDSVSLDAMAMILHSAENWVPFETYVSRVSDYGRKRIRMIQKGLKD